MRGKEGREKKGRKQRRKKGGREVKERKEGMKDPRIHVHFFIQCVALTKQPLISSASERKQEAFVFISVRVCASAFDVCAGRDKCIWSRC